MKSWVSTIKEVADKKGNEVQSKRKKQTFQMRVKKNIAAKAANSKTGKKIIRDNIGADGVAVIDIIKEVIRLKDGEKKSREIESTVIKIAVKIVLLYRNKDISREVLLAPLKLVKTIWSDVLDCCEISFVYDQQRLSKYITELQAEFVKMLKPYLTEKNIERMNETINYLKSQGLLDKLYLSEDCDKHKEQLGQVLRKLWDRIFKKPSSK